MNFEVLYNIFIQISAAWVTYKIESLEIMVQYSCLLLQLQLHLWLPINTDVNLVSSIQDGRKVACHMFLAKIIIIRVLNIL